MSSWTDLWRQHNSFTHFSICMRMMKLKVLILHTFVNTIFILTTEPTWLCIGGLWYIEYLTDTVRMFDMCNHISDYGVLPRTWKHLMNLCRKWKQLRADTTNLEDTSWKSIWMTQHYSSDCQCPTSSQQEHEMSKNNTQQYPGRLPTQWNWWEPQKRTSTAVHSNRGGLGSTLDLLVWTVDMASKNQQWRKKGRKTSQAGTAVDLLLEQLGFCSLTKMDTNGLILS